MVSAVLYWESIPYMTLKDPNTKFMLLLDIQVYFLDLHLCASTTT
jgi:hypothetical protein